MRRSEVVGICSISSFAVLIIESRLLKAEVKSDTVLPSARDSVALVLPV